MLRPADPSRGNGTLLYEVNNRGNIAMLAQINEAPSTNNPETVVDAGNAFLFRQGFTLLWSAWATDVVAGEGRMVLLQLPHRQQRRRGDHWKGCV